MRSIHAAVAILALLASALAGAADAPPSDLSRQMKARALAASFEVVIPRPDESAVTYDKEPPWELIPYQIRNDKYYSIGTAFAVSRTELVTAFHVLALGGESLTFREFYVRDAGGAVYEVDQITGCDQRRDVLRFTVKDRQFPEWLELGSRWEVNQPVFTVGNALGQGNVIRRGDLIGTVKEPIDGRWDLLKSSADVNGGNSGGPLLDDEGRVIGVVIQRSDNISQSLPVGELKAMTRDSAAFFVKAYMTFPIIPEQSTVRTLDYTLPLPAPYKALRQAAAKRFNEFNDAEMGSFLAEQAPVLFPAGESSHEAVIDIAGSTYTEIYNKSRETKTWALSDLAAKSSDLGNNGAVIVSAVTSDLVLGRIRLPDGMATTELFDRPRTFMDLLFKGMEVKRPFGAQSVRITSIGEPFRQATLRDRWGRQWFQATWLNPLQDQVAVAYLAPVPGGVAFMLREVASPRLAMVEYDDRHLLDFIYVPYTGRLKDWQQFMALGDRLPAFFADVDLAVKPGDSLRLRSPWINLDLRQKDWPIEENGLLELTLAVDLKDGQPAWGLRRMLVEQYQTDDYFTVLKHLKPFPGMDDGWVNGWNTVVRGLHPYTGGTFVDEGNSVIAATLPEAGGAPADARFTLYLSQPGQVPASRSRKVFNIIRSAVSIPGNGAAAPAR